MPKIYTFKTLALAAALTAAFGASAYNVSTQPEKKHLLFEEVTGLTCTSCPDVQPYIDRVRERYPDVNIVAIHGPDFINKTFDLSTQGGDEIVKFFDVVSYPQAMLNRVQFPNFARRFLSKEFWDRFLPEVTQEIAPVNLWMSAWREEDSRTVHIDLEAYFLEDVSDLDPHLNIMVTQDGIIAPQSTYKGVDNTWISDHVLRDFITPTWGEPLEDCAQGTYIHKSYTYELPEFIGIFEVVPEDITFVTFVTEDNVNSMNSISTKITTGKPQVKTEIRDEKIKESENYGFNFIEATISNPWSGDIITSAKFNVSLNGNSEECLWTGEILPGETAVLNVPTTWFDNMTEILETNDYEIECVEINGRQVDGDSYTGIFNKPSSCSKELQLIVNPVQPNSLVINLLDVNGEQVSQFGPFDSLEQDSTERIFKLDANSVYCLEIVPVDENDVMPLEAGNSVFSILDVRMECSVLEDVPMEAGWRYFIYTDQAPLGIEDVLNSEIDSLNVYDLGGRLITTVSGSGFDYSVLNPGLYIVKANSGKVSHVKKIIVK